MKASCWKIHDLRCLIGALESGGRPKGGADDESGEIPSLGGENITSEGGIDVSTVRKVPRSFFQTMRKGILRNGDVLINKDGANTGKVGQYRGEFPEAAINEHVFRLRGREAELENGFLFYFLASQVGQAHIRQRISGSAQPGLKSNFVDEMPIALPTEFNHQALVVRVLVTVDRAIEQTETLLAKQQRIKTGLMHDLLTWGLDAQGQLRDPSTHPFKRTEIGEVPNDWDVVPIESLVPTSSPICYGIVQVGPHTHGGIPTIAIRDLEDIQVQNLHHTDSAREKRFARSRCQGGDVLISIKATTGRIGVAPKGFDGNISRDIARVRLLSSERPQYFKYQLQSAAGQARLDSITVGTTRKELSIIPLRLLLVSRPTPVEQEAVAMRIQKSEADLLDLENTIAKLRRLKSGLMHDLLTGTVPVMPLLSNTTP